MEYTMLIMKDDGSGTISDFENMKEELTFKWYEYNINVYRLESELAGTFYISCYSGEKYGNP